MIKDAEMFADEDKKVRERVDAKNAFDGYLHSMRSAAEGSGDNKGLSEKLDDDEKKQIGEAIKDGQSWLDSNPEADAEEIKEKQRGRGCVRTHHLQVLPGRSRWWWRYGRGG